jgi:hypothetical protein
MKTTNEAEMKWAQMGIAALIPGMVHMIELMQAEVNRMRGLLEGVQTAADAPKKRGRPPLIGSQGRPVKGAPNRGWSDDPEERRKEMARRVAKRAGAEESLRHSTGGGGGWPTDPEERAAEAKRRAKLGAAPKRNAKYRAKLKAAALANERAAA